MMAANMNTIGTFEMAAALGKVSISIFLTCFTCLLGSVIYNS